jgi:hypothetical protein
MADNNNMSQPLSAADEKKATDFSAKIGIELPEDERKRKEMLSMLPQKDARKSLQNNSKAFLLQHNDKIDVEKMVGNSK